ALGRSIGLAFQIVDDLLDVTASEAQLGKRAGKDAQIGKLTYPVLLGIDETRRHLAQQQEITEKLSAKLGPAAEPLALLAQSLAKRDR
ncbi:MAG TPA: polyprenyl synthetase family protein, partial [Phycisphaerae bacterium]|nr:polyprenyl synthetase family protein [Phycisphaerae bacterium]